MRASLSQRAYLDWQRYWDFEPWGPWRDNLHTAVLAREIRRPQVRRGSTIDLDQFMAKGPQARKDEAQARGVENMFATLKTIATPISKAEAAKRRRKRK